MSAIKQAVVQQALGEAWSELAPVLRHHYGIRPGRDEEVVMNGRMARIDHSPIAKVFLLPGMIFGALIPYRGNDVPATVRNWTTAEDGGAMFWHRRFHFPGGRQVVFASRMVYRGADEIIEYVRFGLGIRMRMSVDHGALVFRSNGYQWDIGGWSLRFPDWLILGAGEIRESARSDSGFEMEFVMHHPLFGRTFSYSGEFVVDEQG